MALRIRGDIALQETTSRAFPKICRKPTGHGPMEKSILVIQLPGRLQAVTTCPKWLLDNTNLNADHLLQGNPSPAWRFLRELNSMPNVQK